MGEALKVQAHKQNTEAEPRRKPYHKPEFRFERACETMALTCGKISPSQPQCRFNRKVLNASGGTGTITVDNNHVAAEASSVYYTSQSGNDIVKATQAALQ